MYINLEYIYKHIYDFLTGNYGGVWEFFKTVGVIIWVLLIIVVPFLLFAIVYLLRRLAEINKAQGSEVSETIVEEKLTNLVKNPRWEKIMERMSSTKEDDWRLAIIEADSMLEELVADLYPHKGNNLGERLKNIEPSDFATLQDAWDAHKLRNRIAHDRQTQLTEREARIALEQYRRVFEEFHYI